MIRKIEQNDWYLIYVYTCTWRKTSWHFKGILIYIYICGLGAHLNVNIDYCKYWFSFLPFCSYPCHQGSCSIFFDSEVPRGLVDLELILLRCGIGAKGAKVQRRGPMDGIFSDVSTAQICWKNEMVGVFSWESLWYSRKEALVTKRKIMFTCWLLFSQCFHIILCFKSGVCWAVPIYLSTCRMIVLLAICHHPTHRIGAYVLESQP